MSDEQIIKALENCGGAGECQKCPLNSMGKGISLCIPHLTQSAVSLINRQKAEIERLKEIANPKCQQCVEQTRKNSIVEFADEFEKRCVASGIYPAVTKNILKNLVKELTEVKDYE